MNAIFIHDLTKIGNKNNSKILSEKNKCKLYVRIDEKGFQQTSNLVFKKELEAINKNYLYLSFANNQITGEKYFIFSKTEGLELRKINQKSPLIGTQKVSVVRYIAEILSIKLNKSVNKIITLSENISNNSEIFTYKILNIE